MEQSIVTSINESFSLELSHAHYSDMKLALSERINHWINTDFAKLIHVLYRIDISEAKINQLLKENISEDASNILADLVIERELQKIEARKTSPRSTDESEEERW